MSKLKFTRKDLSQLPSAVLYEPDTYRETANISIDSRNIKRSSIFVAIKGEKFDGHDFVEAAVKNGAGAVIINRNKLKYFDELNVPIITVIDTIKALGNLANCWRNKLNLRVISITGSSGKTTVKEMLAVLLSEKYNVHKTHVNNNNHIGVPLTILTARAKHEILILEHGTNHFGEIKNTAKIAEPDVALVTNIGNSHLEYLNDKKGVFKEKSELFYTTWQKKGTVFINTDDVYLKKLAKSEHSKITFGFKDSPKVKGEILNYSDDGFPIIRVTYNNKIIETILPLLGESAAKNFLAAAAVALKFGLTKKQILNAVNKLKPPKQRLNDRKFRKFTLVDDSYNSNPDSLSSSIKAVFNIKNRKNRIFILGDMFELGNDSIELHKNAAKIFKRKSDKIYTIGKMMRYFSAQLNKNISNKHHFSTRNSLKSFLQKLDISDSVILVKGSRGMAMEEFVQVLEDKK
jgi:UDP-N-acetylmuramoyl-tripeptide--D-alanyl-D-alanine ligase